MNNKNKQPSPNAPPEQTWAVLAGLRFWLATLVTLNHSYTIYPLGNNSILSSLGGSSAVLGFFIISGFSIAHSLEHPRGFMRRRMVRILPLYYASILFALLPIALYGPVILLVGNVLITLPATKSILATFLFLQGVVVMCPMLLSPLWSISCEIWYYACAPWFLRQRTFTLQLLAFISLLLYALAVYKLGIYFVYSNYLIATLCLTWAWLAGFLYYSKPKSPLTLFLLIAGALLTCNVTFTIALLVVVFAPRIRLSSLFERVFIYLGEISYPLYLTHWTVFVIIGGSSIGYSLPWWFLPIIWLATLAVAIFFHQAIDLPIRAYFRSNLPAKEKREMLTVPLILFTLAVLAVPLWPVQKATRILPLGDSITYGYISGEPSFYSGYREKLEQLLTVNSMPFTLVGSLKDPLGRRHDGYPGWRIDQLTTIIPDILQETRPHIILLQAGTNDLLQHADLKIVEKRIITLLDTLHFMAPGSIVLITSIPPLCHSSLVDKVAPESTEYVAEFNLMLERTIHEHTIQGKIIEFVNVSHNSAITCSDMNDGIHPNYVGYSKMATAWADILKPYLIRFSRD